MRISTQLLSGSFVALTALGGVAHARMPSGGGTSAQVKTGPHARTAASAHHGAHAGAKKPGVTGEPINTGTGAGGTVIQAILISAESNQAARMAPTKAPLSETQPQSIITHSFIAKATPASGDYTTAIQIAPSVSGISSMGGGIGETNTSTLRGFQDGQFNITYDGIAFGDSNDLTHHASAFFPASTIGAAVVDRGPGSAGDMGEANFGGAVHLFSPIVSDQFHAKQDLTYGTFNTQDYVTQVQTGSIGRLHGTKALFSLEERQSNGALSYSNGAQYNQLVKVLVPISNDALLTLFATWNYARFHMTDVGEAMGVGQTAQQLALYGKNFALNNNPYDEHYYKFNRQNRRSVFTYANLKWKISGGKYIEDHLYWYNYDNNTESPQSVADLVNQNPGPQVSPSSAPISYSQPTDIGGYYKILHYHIAGNIFRFNDDMRYGTLRTGFLVENSSSYRYLVNWDLTANHPDYLNPPQYDEGSTWFQYQLFADFVWRPTEKLTITPGIKLQHERRSISATYEPDGIGAHGTKTYQKPTYFFTANYRLTHFWSVYAQAATALLIPPLKTLAAQGGTAANTQPQKSLTTQVGTVYTHGAVTFDADVYKIHATNVLFNETGSACKCYRNLGTGDYYGVEFEGAYDVGSGLVIFANGSINRALNNPGNGTPSMEFSNAPEATGAFGLLYQRRRWGGSLYEKYVGTQLGSDGATWIGGYGMVNGTVSYRFDSNYQLRLAVFNMGDTRPLTDFDGTFYAFAVGRQIQATLSLRL